MERVLADTSYNVRIMSYECHLAQNEFEVDDMRDLFFFCKDVVNSVIRSHVLCSASGFAVQYKFLVRKADSGVCENQSISDEKRGSAGEKKVEFVIKSATLLYTWWLGCIISTYLWASLHA